MGNFKMVAIAAGMSGTLAACGGGGDGGGSGKVATYNQLLQTGTQIVEGYQAKVDAGSDIATPVAAMQKKGSATYTGVGMVSLKEDPDMTGAGVLVRETTDKNGVTIYEYEPQLLGKARLTADFDKKSLEGSVGDFQARKGYTTTGGNVRYSGNIDGNETFGRLVGKVNLDGKDHAIKIDGEGGFLGDRGQHVGVFGDDSTDGFDETLDVMILGEKN